MVSEYGTPWKCRAQTSTETLGGFSEEVMNKVAPAGFWRSFGWREGKELHRGQGWWGMA